MSWLTDYAKQAGATDKLPSGPEHLSLLASGVFGEAGSIVTAMKKAERDREAYPTFDSVLREESGDFLWYFTRLAALVDSSLLRGLRDARVRKPASRRAQAYLHFAGEAGRVAAVLASKDAAQYRTALTSLWRAFVELAEMAGVNLREAAAENLAKTQSRWPTQRIRTPLFDAGFPLEEQLPRLLRIDFVARKRGRQDVVTLRCNGLNFGDTLSDNILDPDGYRYHDVFHFAHAAVLGWSPVVRAILRCKRKSQPKIDEAEDGARAGIVEEALSAQVFSRAKTMKLFSGVQRMEYDVLKMIRELVQGYEAHRLQMWEWEDAILTGYRVFRSLRANGGGRVTLNLSQRRLGYTAPRKAFARGMTS